MSAGLASYLRSRHVRYLATRFVARPLLPRGYGRFEYRGWSDLHRAAGGAVTVREEDEIYRGAAKGPAGIAHNLVVVWRLPGAGGP